MSREPGLCGVPAGLLVQVGDPGSNLEGADGWVHVVSPVAWLGSILRMPSRPDDADRANAQDPGLQVFRFNSAVFRTGRTYSRAAIVRGDVGTEVTKLKEQEGGDLLVYGPRPAHRDATQPAASRCARHLDPSHRGWFGKLLFREGQNANMELVATKAFRIS